MHESSIQRFPPVLRKAVPKRNVGQHGLIARLVGKVWKAEIGRVRIV